MSTLREPAMSFVGGTVALFRGIDRSVRSPEIRYSYVRFTAHFFVITAMGYLIVSGSMMAIFPVAFILLLGPCLGPIVLLVFCYLSCFVLLVLWLMGRFPKKLFTGSFGILRPFYSVPQMSFLLASVIIAMPCETFFMEGIDACYADNAAVKSEIRSQYKKPNFVKTLQLACCNSAFGIALKLALMIVPLGRSRPWLEGLLSAFLLGCQLASVFTVRIKGMSFKSHISWCMAHAPRILGFSLPLHLAQSEFGWIGMIMMMGISYSATAALVEDLVVDTSRPTAHAHIY